MYKENGPGSGKDGGGKPLELTDEEIRWIRAWRKTAEHFRWLCRTLKPIGITVGVTIAGLAPFVSGMKEIIKWWTGK